MKVRKTVRLSIGLAAFVVLGISILAFSTAGQEKEKTKRTAVPRRQDQLTSAPNQFEITLAQLPIVDYSAPDLPDPKERAKRQAKSKNSLRTRDATTRRAVRCFSESRR